VTSQDSSHGERCEEGQERIREGEACLEREAVRIEMGGGEVGADICKGSLSLSSSSHLVDAIPEQSKQSV
jgi:hypothetical protein